MTNTGGIKVKRQKIIKYTKNGLFWLSVALGILLFAYLTTLHYESRARWDKWLEDNPAIKQYWNEDIQNWKFPDDMPQAEIDAFFDKVDPDR